jgi:outer membrane protein OmpA-like peptidoglycan-associated protein
MFYEKVRFRDKVGESIGGDDFMLGRTLSFAIAATATALLLAACDQPQPAAPPPPPQAPMASSFRVLFASGSSTVQTPEQATIQQAAAAYKSRAGASVTLTGHADTTGNPGYNQVLSKRRVDAVTAGLVAAGVPASSISGSASGDMNPPVATGSQVSDQKNRSVEITVTQAPGPMMTDAQYCGMLAPKVRDASRGADPTGDLGRALASCQNGTGDYGIPFMTRYLSTNNIPVPPRT